ncbi:MAG: cytosine permease [Anaerovoracaceae bacterium]|uniref:Cytosine permease n=1 Tax=Candidatus Allocopromorpha excrementavium TaxID=2840741 RepID=A0A9D1HEY6_9FIRM|nr:cytosine permease [Candidatus Copromorpha excrementavium]
MSEKERKEQAVDKDYPLQHVPANARRSLISISCVLIGFTFFTPTMASGASLGAAFTFDELILIIVAGSLILGLYVAAMCLIGARTGLTCVLQSKYTFGKAGAKWSDIILGGTQIFWYAITAEYMGSLFSMGLGLDTAGWKIFFIIFWGVIMGVTAIYGVKAMSIVSYVAIPLMAALMIIVMIMAVREAGSLDAIRAITPSSSMTVTSAITIIVGTFASGGTQAGNWARFAKTGATAFIAGLLGFLVGNGVMIFSGMLGGLVFHTGDLIELMISMGIVFWALIILTLNIWTTNNATAYAFGVAGAEMFNKNNKNPFIIGGIIIALIMAILGISNYFLPMLNLLGTFVPPLGGVIIGDYFFVCKGKIPRLEYVHFKTWRIAPIIAYILGCAAAYFGGVFEIGMPALQGIIISMLAVPVIHIIFVKFGINDEHDVDENAEYI